MLETKDKTKKELRNKQIKLDYDSNRWYEKYGEYYNTVLLFITTACQLNCPKCFCFPERASIKQYIPYEVLEKIIANNPEIDKYDIMGGEPLLHPDFNRILDLMANHNKKAGIYTNAILLRKMPTHYKNVKLNMAFHSINSNNPAEKPISKSIDDINYIQDFYPVKIVYLMTEDNKHKLGEFVEYCEENLPKLKKITIGTIRDEGDYYDDSIDGIIPLEEYANIIIDFVNKYKGRLNIDIFSEGILYTDSFPQKQKHQINRFKSIFPANKDGKMFYADCLYDIGTENLHLFKAEEPLEYKNADTCPKTGKNRCITDKIKLVQKTK